MADKTFTCTVLTPERAVLEAQTQAAVIPAYDGEIGILRNRAPLLCRLGIGLVRLDSEEGSQRLFVDAGFAEVVENKLTILTEQALLAEEIDVEREEAALSAARQTHPTTTAERDARGRVLARSTAKLKLARG